MIHVFVRVLYSASTIKRLTRTCSIHSEVSFKLLSDAIEHLICCSGASACGRVEFSIALIQVSECH